MYSDCMFCGRSLGTNAVLETFPVGRRVAFDSARGRLWVVCRRCERWNLTPMEERWEAVEDCERFFGEIRLQVSTDNIGLARHAEGLELVRIGRPLRPEFAAWRYGDQFGRRRKRAIVYGVAGATLVGVVAVGGALAGAAMGPFLAQTGNFYRIWQCGGRPLKVRGSDGRILKLNSTQIRDARVSMDAEGWALDVKARWSWRTGEVYSFRGDEAERVAGILLTRINHTGGNRDTVRDAVHAIEEAGHPEAFLESSLTRLGQGRMDRGKGRLSRMPAPSRLALEMALHEEHERRALEGELRGLEIIWRREEEIAAIADDLLLPEDALGKLETLRGDGGAAVADVETAG